MLFADAFYFHHMFHTELLLIFLQYTEASSEKVQTLKKLALRQASFLIFQPHPRVDGCFFSVLDRQSVARFPPEIARQKLAQPHKDEEQSSLDWSSSSSRNSCW